MRDANGQVVTDLRGLGRELVTYTPSPTNSQDSYNGSPRGFRGASAYHHSYDMPPPPIPPTPQPMAMPPVVRDREGYRMDRSMDGSVATTGSDTSVTMLLPPSSATGTSPPPPSPIRSDARKQSRLSARERMERDNEAMRPYPNLQVQTTDAGGNGSMERSPSSWDDGSAANKRITPSCRKKVESPTLDSAEKRRAYLESLRLQIEEKKAREERTKREQLSAERRMVDQMSSVSPWGRPGCGAPMRDANGQVVTSRSPQGKRGSPGGFGLQQGQRVDLPNQPDTQPAPRSSPPRQGHSNGRNDGHPRGDIPGNGVGGASAMEADEVTRLRRENSALRAELAAMHTSMSAMQQRLMAFEKRFGGWS